MKTLKELREKSWYRALIVIYLLLFSLFLFSVWVSGTGFEGLLIVSIIFWIIRGSFCYISIGEFNPKE